MSIIQQEACIRSIVMDHRHDLIDKLKTKWLTGDLRAIFGVIVYIHKGIKKDPTFENVKGTLERMGDIRDNLRASYIHTLITLKDTFYVLANDPQGILKNEYENRQVTKLIDKLKITELATQKDLIRDAAQNLSEDVDEKHIYNLQDSINEFLKQVESGEIDEIQKSAIDIKDYKLMQIWGKKIFPFPYCIGARPGDFKTSLLIELVKHLWENGKKGLFFSLEDNIDTLRAKFIANKYGIAKDFLLYGGGKEKILSTVKPSDNKRLHVVDKNQDVNTFRSEIDTLMREYTVDYIALDYIQLFSGERDETKKLTYISREFMHICKEYKVPIIFTSQVTTNETDKTTNDGALHMGHVKGSRSIAENCRHMVFMWGQKNTSTRTIGIAKNTWGGCGEKEIEFNGETGGVISVN